MANLKLSIVATAILTLFTIGSTQAANWEGGDLTVNVGENQNYDAISLGDGKKLNNQGNLFADSISINGGAFSNTGTVVANSIDFYGKSSFARKFEGSITATDHFTYRGAGHNQYGTRFDAKLTTNHFIIDSHNAIESQVGVSIHSNEVFENVGKISIIGAVSKTGLQIGGAGTPGSIKLNAPVYLDGADGDARIEVIKGWSLEVGHVIAEGQGKAKLQPNSGGLIKVKTLEVAENSKLTLQAANGSRTDESHFTIDNWFVNDNASIVATAGAAWADPIAVIDTSEGTLNVTLGTNAKVDLGGTQYKEEDPSASPNGESIKIDADSIAVRVNSKDPSSSSFILPNFEGNVTTKPENITVTASGLSNTGDAEADLEKLANVVIYSSRVDGTAELNTKSATGASIIQEANDLFDGAKGVVSEDGQVKDVTKVANANIYGISEMNTVGLHIWRNEINDMNKRLGEIRDSRDHLNGLWTRVYTGEAEMGSQSITNEYTAFQFGYDRQIMPNVFAGAAFSYTDGDNDFAVGGGENQIYALTAYGSYVADSGLFVDVTAKFGRLKNEFDISLADGTRSSGDYDANAFSMSAEAGWRFNANEMFFIEPQVEMMYGWVESVDYKTSTGLLVEHDKAESLIGRAGMVLGLSCPSQKGNAYVRASVLHDFKGEADYSFSKNGDVRSLSEDLGGTWYEYGIGANFNATKQLHIYADVEAANGGEVDTDYRVNLGMRYSF